MSITADLHCPFHVLIIFPKLFSAVLLAVAIPNLELFISLFGAFCLSALGLAFPALIELCTYWKIVGGYEKVWLIVKTALIVAVGIAGLTIGTYTSLVEIVKTFFLTDGHHA